MRVFLPATLPLLRSWLAAGSVPASTCYAVTPGLRAVLEGDDEELAYAATTRAARGSLRLLLDAAEPRRVVLAVDAEAEVRDDLDDGAVRIAVTPWRAVAAGLVDAPEAVDVVATAASLVDAADLGDEDAELAVGDAEDHELLWYATQELADL